MRAHTITTQARVGGRLRMNCRVVVVSAVLLGAAVIAAGASGANFSSVDDPRGDVECIRHHRVTLSHLLLRVPGEVITGCSDSRKRNADVVRATAEHEGGRLRHTIRVVGEIQHWTLTINTDSDSESEWHLGAERGGGGGLRCRRDGVDTGRVRADFHLHSVEIFFSKRCIGNPRRYGWRANAIAGPPRKQAVDFVPNGGGYIRQRLG
jgi:hypothetical protein